MTIEQLANAEMELHSTVLDIYSAKQSEELNERLKTVFALYRQVHISYALLAKEQDEALKRGLFIQWYSMTEPSYISGIDQLDEEAEHNIIDALEEKIQNNTLDSELNWMLNYYANWDFVFERFNNRKGLVEFISHKTDRLPPGLEIDKADMKKRGQMGDYWNSLDHFRTQI